MARQPSSYVAPGAAILELRSTDRLPSLVFRIVDDQQQPADLTDADVFVLLRRTLGSIGCYTYPLGEWAVGKQALVIGDPTDGVAYYDWQTADFACRMGIEPNHMEFTHR